MYDNSHLALLGTRAYMEVGLEFIQFPGSLCREKVIYDDSHLVSLGASLFQVPKSIQRVKCGIFSSPGDYIMGKARNFSKLQGHCIGCIGRKVYMATRTSLRSSRFQSLYRGGFQVSEAIQRTRAYMGERAWNFSKSQSLYKGGKVYKTTRTSLRSILRSSKFQRLYRE